jgi:DNA-binding PadR family transcriptional regulator
MVDAVPDARALLPLKPLVFEILLALEAGQRHGWSLVRDIQQQSRVRILPANFYRTLRTMLADGLIDETDAPRRERAAAAADALERRRYFGLTALGREAARLEARRLQQLVSDARTQRLLNSRKPGA